MAAQACSGQQATNLVYLEIRDKRCTPCHLSVTLNYYTCKWDKDEAEDGKICCFFLKPVFSESKNAPEKRKEKKI